MCAARAKKGRKDGKTGELRMRMIGFLAAWGWKRFFGFSPGFVEEILEQMRSWGESVSPRVFF